MSAAEPADQVRPAQLPLADEGSLAPPPAKKATPKAAAKKPATKQSAAKKQATKKGAAKKTTARKKPVPTAPPADLPVLDASAHDGAVDVLVDGSGQLGALSYFVPRGMKLAPGDAVHVPFGKREAHGMVLGPGNPAKATRAVSLVYGRRCHPRELELAAEIARRHFAALGQVAVRLSPRTGRGHDPLDAGPLELDTFDDERDLVMPEIPDAARRRYLLRAPLVDPARLAALEARRMCATEAGGQVLILCPTVELVEATLARFSSGAVRVDSKAQRGAWRGFCEGHIPVAVGTRTAALFSADRLAGVIVVEDGHPGHVEATQPHTHARDVALLRAAAHKVPLTLIGANPDPAALGGRIRVFAVGGPGDWPHVALVDRNDFAPVERLVPRALPLALRRARKDGHEPVVLAQRRKAVRRCVRCAEERPCSQCTSSACRHPEEVPCPKCMDLNVRMVGWDAERIGSMLGSQARTVSAAELGECHDVGLAVIFDIDAALSAPGINPEAIAAHLIVTAAAAAGPGGTLMVLTRQSDHPLLVDLCQRQDQVAVARRAWSIAKDAGLPPFGRLVRIQTARKASPNVSGWPGRVYGPRRNGKEWEILVRIDDDDLDKLSRPIASLRRGGKVRITVS